jgi:hypothetical protein
VDDDTSKLFQELRKIGFSNDAINAALPSWWSDDIATSPSSRAELRFALARKLGLAAKPLLGERVEFVWKDSARFKHLTTQDAVQQNILSSFGVAIGRLLLRGTPVGRGFTGLSPLELRESILNSEPYVDLQQLLATCWALGVPVIQLRVFPLTSKSMHAMVIESSGRHAILLGRNASYPAPAAFTLAHEIGHIACGHTRGTLALIDVEDPALAKDRDTEESQADAFALSMLTGSPAPEISTQFENFNAPTLADAVLKAGPQYRIEPGTLALCVAYRKKNWPVAMSAMRFIYSESKPVWQEVNRIAELMLDWDAIGPDGSDFIRNLMNSHND